MKTTSRSFRAIAVAALALQVLFTAPASATRLIPFQGRVTDGNGQPLQGVFRVTFVIYDEATGGTALYTESHTDVSIIGGQVNVLLGSLISLDDPNADQSFGDAVHFDDTLRPRYLGIKVGADTNQEMVPRHQLVPSFHARIADTTVDDGVGNAQIADGAVTAEKIDPTVLLPPGAIMPYGGSTAPPGWVLCDGTTYDGTLPEFNRLFDAIGLGFGGSGNMFKVPDLRGQFLRGRDAGAGVDPDAAARTGGDTIGSTQGSATIGLSGGGGTNSAGGHVHGLNSLGAVDLVVPGNARYILFGASGVALNTDAAGDHSHSVSVTVAPPANLTSTEVRPKNVAVNYICKL